MKCLLSLLKIPIHRQMRKWALSQNERITMAQKYGQAICNRHDPVQICPVSEKLSGNYFLACQCPACKRVIPKPKQGFKMKRNPDGTLSTDGNGKYETVALPIKKDDMTGGLSRRPAPFKI